MFSFFDFTRIPNNTYTSVWELTKWRNDKLPIWELSWPIFTSRSKCAGSTDRISGTGKKTTCTPGANSHWLELTLYLRAQVISLCQKQWWTDLFKTILNSIKKYLIKFEHRNLFFNIYFHAYLEVATNDHAFKSRLINTSSLHHLIQKKLDIFLHVLIHCWTKGEVQQEGKGSE